LKCRKCHTEFNQINTLQKYCYGCALEKAKELTKKKEDKEWRKRKSEMKEKTKTVSDYRNDARYWFQRWIRYRDVFSKCISCDTLLLDIREFDAGHYFSASGTPQLLFNEFNCNGQCVFCNKHKSGNLIYYRKGLIERYGERVVLELENIAEFKGKRIHTKYYYVEVADKYKKLVKEIEKIK